MWEAGAVCGKLAGEERGGLGLGPGWSGAGRLEAVAASGREAVRG